MSYLKWLDDAWETIRGRTLRIVAFPIPPVETAGLLFMPDSYDSSLFDYNWSRNYNLTTMVITHLGPAVLMYEKVEKIFAYHNGMLSVKGGACCAGTSFRVWDDLRTPQGKRVDFARDVQLTSLKLVGASCNRSSHLVIPRAPFATAYSQYAVSKDRTAIGKETIQFLAPEQAERYFPGCDFAQNAGIDRVLSYFAVSREVGFFKAGNIGNWARSPLVTLRNNGIYLENGDGHPELDCAGEEDGWSAREIIECWRVAREVCREGREADDPAGDPDSPGTPGALEGQGPRDAHGAILAAGPALDPRGDGGRDGGADGAGAEARATA
jgi:hypothetical protein